MNKETCPMCGFQAHMASSDGKIIVYVCERCKNIFKVVKK